MATIDFLTKLFQAHVYDFQEVTNTSDIIFICPICFEVFYEEDINNRELTDGHIWPKYLRRKVNTNTIKEQRVLLCKKCNHTARTRGDAQISIHDQIRRGRQSGVLHGERRVQVFGSNDGLIELNANITKPSINSIILHFTKTRNSELWAHNNPKEQERFGQVINSQQSMSIIVHPYHKHKSTLAKAGWITSAYLYAFYTFGYRYIMQSELEGVRKYIIQSFEQEPLAHEIEKLGVQMIKCENHYYAEPEIAIIVPINNTLPVHLQVSLLDYHVNLPLGLIPEILQQMIMHAKDKNHLDLSNNQLGQGPIIAVVVKCTKTYQHECIFDYLLGKAPPE